MKLISREEFEKQYAARSGITVEELRELGLVVLPCDCGAENCQGWAVVHRDNIETHVRLYTHTS
jgi:hypothetical protein